SSSVVTETGVWFSVLRSHQVSKACLAHTINKSPDSHFVIPSSSDTSLNATLGVPMPTPGTPGAPKFKGKHVSDFLDALEQHADS
ncbi:hypothetical protein K443DRAFT_35610, partial [Laccaria amethystina LaAM-08-1]